MKKEELKSYEEVLAHLPTSAAIRDLSDSEVDKILEPLSLMDKIRIMKDNFPLSMRYPEYLYKMFRAEIMQYYMNALTTYYGALGHNKADMNEFRKDKYEDFMKEMNIPIPAKEVSFVLGQFNGKGSA
tara:strand:+ start:334 stop:717 length:384 start_codon:yes stop_codon:yes gene_type:complete